MPQPIAGYESVYVARLAQLYDLFNQHDIPGILEIFTDDVQWDSYGPQFVKALGTYQGKSSQTGIVRFFDDLGYQQADTLFQPQFYYPSDTIVNASGIEEGWWMNGMQFVNHWNHTIWFHPVQGNEQPIAYQFRANYNIILSGEPTHAPFPPKAASDTDGRGNFVDALRRFLS